MFWKRKKNTSKTAATSETPFEHAFGRKFIRNSHYELPVDFEEMNRLDFQHFVLRLALHGNFAAPIRNPRTILDIGSGTGRWGIEMAKAFPKSEVFGIDLVQPPEGSITYSDERPPNYHFQIGNITETLNFPDRNFDYVHMRLLFSGIPATAWPHVLDEMIRVTEIGGWIESIEALPLRNGGPYQTMMGNWFLQTFQSRGIDPYIAEKIPEMLCDRGIGNISAKKVETPIGKHGGRLGMLLSTDGNAIIKSLKKLIVSQGLATEELYDIAVSKVEEESNTAHSMQPNVITIGQRIT